MSIRLPSHLYRNQHGGFYFRFVIPQDLRHHLNQREVRFSLNTEQRHEAILAAFPLIADLPRLTADLRRMTDDKETPPPDHFKIWIEVHRKNSILKSRIEELESELHESQQQIAAMVPRDNAKRVVKAAYDKGQLKGVRDNVFPWPSELTKLYSELVTAYMKSLITRAEGGRKKPPTPKTIEEYEKTLREFITIMGDCHIGEIKREIAGEYFTILKALPKNLTRTPKYHGKTIPEIIAMNDPPQSEPNCSKKLERISTMFKWALVDMRTWGIDTNPFTGFGQAERV